MAGEDKLEIAEKHLLRVQAAWFSPTDWDDLSIYGFYCLENAVDAAALHFGLAVIPQHHRRLETAQRMARDHGLPNITELLNDLNDARKYTAYGDTEHPSLDAEDLASRIEDYVRKVREVIESTNDDR